MRETDFINQNKHKWTELEELLHEETKDPDKLSNLFVQVTDDLSYSRTFYPNRSVRVYLNNIAQQVFYSIYKNKKESKSHFINFWKEELPRLVYEARKELLFAFIVFGISVGIGVLSCFNDAHFVRVILGDSYVNMTIENIRKGDPMAVYKKMNGVDMFLGITLNNTFIAFKAFVLGVFYVIGTIAILMYNGIMVGAFQYFFYERGLFLTSFLTIWMHGTLEISCIIIGAGAGITMGKGLVFPGTYSRIQSFLVSARRGFKILLGVVPILFLAAFIETFVTRYTDAPDLVKGSIILFSMLFIVGYFVWYPYVKSRRGFALPVKETRLTAMPESKIDIQSIRTNGELFKDIFTFYKKSFRKLIRPILALSLAATVCLALIHYFSTGLEYKYRNWFFAFQFFNYGKQPWFYPINSIMFSINILFVLKNLKKQLDNNIRVEKESFGFNAIRFLKIFVVMLLLNAVFFWDYSFLATLLVSIFTPFCIMWIFMGNYKKKDVRESFSRSFSVINISLGKVFGLFFMLAFLCMIFFFMVDSPLVYLYFEVLNWNLNLDRAAAKEIIMLLMVFSSFLVINLVLPILIAGNSLVYFSLIEIESAHWLREKLKIISDREKKR